MCGRYTLTADLEQVARTFQVAPVAQNALTDGGHRYNIAPTQHVVTVMGEGDGTQRHLALLRWGLVPTWAKEETLAAKMINARAETLAEKPSFKRLVRVRRCLVVADGFYEWKQDEHSKTPMYITLKTGGLLAFAGIWDEWKHPDGAIWRTCAIITTQANALVAPIHERMPVILSPEAYATWLNTQVHDEHVLLPLLAPYPAEQMMARAVSKQVNNPRYDSAELIA